MPYKCLNCGKIYEDNDPRVLKGCESCGGKMFVYIGSEAQKESGSAKELQKLELEVKESSRGDAVDITIKGSKEEVKIEGVETIVIEEPGKYIIDIDKLMKGQPIVLKMKDGDYRIYLPSLFGRSRKKV